MVDLLTPPRKRILMVLENHFDESINNERLLREINKFRPLMSADQLWREVRYLDEKVYARIIDETLGGGYKVRITAVGLSKVKELLEDFTI